MRGRGGHEESAGDTDRAPSDAPSGHSGRASGGSGRAVIALRRLAAVCAVTARAAPGTLLLHIGLSLLVSALPVVTAWLMKLVLDDLASGAPSTLLWPGTAMACIGVTAVVASQAMRYARAELDRRVGLEMQDRLFAAVDGFVGLGKFENPHFLDRLRLAQQAGHETATHVAESILGVVRAGATIGGFLGSLFLVSPVMAGILLVAGVPVLWSEVALARRRARMLWEVGPVERREFFYADLLSSVEAAKEVRLFGIGPFLRERMLTERRTANAAKRAMDRREIAVQTGLGGLAALVSGGGLLWAVLAARGGALSVGDVTMFVAAIAGVQGALTSLAGDAAQGQQTLLMFDHYTAVTRATSDLPVADRPRPLPALRHGIELRDVWFRYSPDLPWVLRGVDLHIPQGRALALVGLNGAGKSTLVKLLCRFYDPTHGAILWDGVDIREVDPARLRERVGAVFQDYMQYDMTAAENIALGDLTVLADRGRSRERMRQAAQRAGIDRQLAALPRGYDTLLTRMFFTEEDKDNPETGVVLSGGQWQRLALARAFLRDACTRRELMILDEPSAGLDAEAEHEIHASLRSERSTRTSLLISHRLSALRDADIIVVLKDGRVAERGDHTLLMAVGGEYARLFTLQAGGYQLSAEESSVAPEEAV
ncbi:ABC transporter ATP-binding protein [Streptomyces sp. Inha503]|uniref:ABC transporter ATP-binding protein n=1 Tax=Streptomyces sp. Inha503 TaxID=3383314 RepID=UPI0039A0CFC6